MPVKKSKKFKISMMRHLINHMMDCIVEKKGFTPHKHYVLDTEAELIMERAVSLNCDSLIDGKGTHEERRVVQIWRNRREHAIGIALRMKLIKLVQYEASQGDNNFWVSLYEKTKFGNIFHKAPQFLQFLLIAVTVGFLKIANVATRFKWITGIVSFAVLAIKVWHSGLISSSWIALSALIGLVAGILASLW